MPGVPVVLMRKDSPVELADLDGEVERIDRGAVDTLC
jgi:hypothetical protein